MPAGAMLRGCATLTPARAAAPRRSAAVARAPTPRGLLPGALRAPTAPRGAAPWRGSNAALQAIVYDNDTDSNEDISDERLRPFLHPDLAAVFKDLPPRSNSSNYLKAAARNVLAEYRLALQESNGGFVSFTLVPPEQIVSDRDDDIFVRSVLSVPRDDAEEATEVALKDLHYHVGVWQGDIAILAYAEISLKEPDSIDDAPLVDGRTPVLRIMTGARWVGRPFDLDEDDDIFVDLGFIGDAINERAAALELLKREPSSLLCSIADPQLRRTAAYRSPSAASTSVVPINATQRRVLDGMRFDVEAIQGPPGTGKSTLIYHIVASYAPEDSVTLATCVQNKAVDAIAEKLAQASMPFFVHGNDARLGLLAKEWTLPSQIERDERVRLLAAKYAAAEQRLRRLQNQSVSSLLREGAEQEERQLSIQLEEERASVCAELVQAARAILCTVATASRSLLNDEIIEAAVQRITTAVLDEAGTCPETKLPLLLKLPELERVIAVGDHKQLKPFTRWKPASSVRGQAGGKRGVCHFYNGRPGSCRRVGCQFEHRDPLIARGSDPDSIGCGSEPTGFFQRVRAALPDGAVGTLVEQYRMHAAIAAFVSATFYDAALSTPPAIAAARAAADEQGLWWLSYPEAAAESKRGGSKSFMNDIEVATVMAVLRSLEQQRGARSVMVITFYRGQEAQLRRSLAASGLAESIGDSDGAALRVMTVDQAQGSEADVVILSCVRSNPERELGFVRNPNRMNVAISRARERLVVVGDAATLCTDAKWAGLRAACRVISNAHELPKMPAK